MQSIKLQAHVGEDGVLKLEVPLDVTNTRIEVLVVVQPVATPEPPYTEWPEGYFEETAGCLADDPIERGPQGEYEKREELL